MDGLELFPVTVEGDWSPDQTRSVQNKLLLHFQSKKRSKGGECRVELEDGAPRAVVSFKSAQVRDLVLAKKNHEIQLANQTLKLRLITGDTSASNDRATPHQSDKDSQSAPSSSVLLLEAIPASLTPELLGAVVEIASGSDESGFSLEMLWESGRAVVTFKNPKDAEQLLAVSPTHPRLQKHGLTVQVLEAADSIRVEGLTPNIHPDVLEKHFGKCWVLPLDIKLIPEEEAAIVIFKETKVVESICLTKDHMISSMSVPIRIYPYHRSLETALYGAERPPWKLPAPITDKVHPVVWKYLQKKKLSKSINDQMRPHFCRVDLEEPEAKLGPLPGLLRQKNLSAELVEAWTTDAVKAFRRVMSQFSAFECPANAAVWKAVENNVHMEVKEDAVLLMDIHRGVLVVGGLADNIKRLRAPVETIVSKAMDQMERQINTTSEGMSLTPDWFLILKEKGLLKAANDISPELKVSYDEDVSLLTITGLPNEVSKAKVWILEQQKEICKKHMSFSPCLVDFIKTLNPMDVYKDLFKSDGITATFSVEGRDVVLVGSSVENLVNAEKKMNLALSIQTLDVEDQRVLKLQTWIDLNQKQLNTYNTARKTVAIQTNQERSKISVVGFKDQVEKVSKILREFLSNYAHVQEGLPLHSLAVTQFLDKNKSQDLIRFTKDKNVSVLFEQKRAKILLSGPRLHVQELKSWFINLTADLFTDTLTVNKPGAKKYFETQGRMFLSSIMTEFNCVALLKSKIQLEDDSDIPVQTAGGVRVSVRVANICTFRADAVVNAANETLQHVGGVALALLKAAGSELQTSSDKYVAKNGKLWPGMAVVTPSFALPCKYVIHAVGPRFSWAEQKMAVEQLKDAVNESLKQADLHQCATVALPAISSGIYGFPIDLCAESIAQAVKDYCNGPQGPVYIKEVHLVDNNVNTVRVLAKAVNREFGESGAGMCAQQEASGGSLETLSHRSQTSGGSGPVPLTHWVDELEEAPKRPSRVDTETKSLVETDLLVYHRGSVSATHVTAEGLKVVLCEGNIQDQTTDVIVNTISPDLNLAQGAVSKAILSVAGPGLQNAVRSQAGSGSIPYGKVIVTDGYKLNSPKVFHMVCPHWNGQAKEVLLSIIRFCLEEAEQLQVASLSFPAVGTGNLKFPREVVSRVLLKEIHSFSRRSTLSYLRAVVVVVHPSDKKTVDCFTKDFLPYGGSTNNEWEELDYEGEDVISQSQQASAPPSLVSSPSPGVYQMKIHQLTLEVSSGDITKDASDVIVNSSNPDFDLKKGVSKAILDAAGPVVALECAQIVTSPNYQKRGMISTSAGKLPSSHIVHIYVPSEPDTIKDAVYSVLKFCEERNFTSVCFPALGTGEGGAKPSEVADAMVEAVMEFEKKKQPQFVQKVKILIFQTAMILEFHKSMMRKTSDKSKGLMHYFKTGANLLKDTFSSILPKMSNDQQMAAPLVLKTEEFEPIVLELCAEDKKDVIEAKRRIEDLIMAEQGERTICDPSFRLLSKDDLAELRALQRKLTVSFHLDPGHEDQDPILHLQGLTRDVFTAESEVRDMIRRVERAENQMKQAQKLSVTVQWQYMDLNGKLLSFDELTNLNLEEGRYAKRNVTITINKEKFKADPIKMKAKAERGRSQIDLFRSEEKRGADLPKHWSSMQGEVVKMFPVSNLSDEFSNVEKELRRTGLSVTIISMERVQNPTLYQSYELMKKQLQQKNNSSNNEKLLFHGTSSASIELINNKGFNRSYAGIHGAMWGNGSYFAVNPAYSAQGYAKPDANGHKRMYLARVLVGDFTVGKQGLIAPPVKSSANQADLYDSVTDNQNPPSMFVVFNDIQAYPEYLITFT